MEIMNNDKINIANVETSEQLAKKTLDIFVDSANKAIEQKGVFYVAISGGKTPRLFYEQLGADPSSVSLDWNKIEIFWVDERCVKPNSADSNYRLAADTFLKSISIPPDNVHRIIGENNDYNQTVEQ